MPGGVPVATVAIGQAGNAALLAVQILATSDEDLREKLVQHKQDLRDRVAEMDASVSEKARRPAPSDS